MTGKIEYFKVESTLNHEFNTTENTNEFRVVQLYINNTNEDICVVHRNNLPIIMKKSTQYFGGTGNFTVRTIYHFNGKDQIVATINNLDRVINDSKISNPELEIVIKALQEAYNSSNGAVNYYSVSLDKEIPIKKVKRHPAIYIHEADIVICDPRAMTRCHHPYSDEGMVENQYREFIEQKKVSGIFVELIDNENKINTRYMYVAKQLVEIPAREDKSRKSGVYFTRAGFDHLDQVHIEPEFYTTDAAETEIGMYRTAEEAQTGGNPDSLIRIEEKRTAREFAEFKRRAELDKIEAEEKLRKLQSELDETKLKRNDYYEDKKLNRNDKYEERSYERKDNSEIWKLASAICITGLTVYAATVKANTSSK